MPEGNTLPHSEELEDTYPDDANLSSNKTTANNEMQAKAPGETQDDAEVQIVADQGLQYQASDLPMNYLQCLAAEEKKVAQLLGHKDVTVSNR